MKILTRLALGAAAMLWTTPSLMADAPASYYSRCENLGGQNLLQALYQIVGTHTNVGYDGLWTVYETSDIYPEDGRVWDMYSTKHWVVNRNQCGNYSSVGDCYNREHSFPKSWFGNASPMVSDAFHIYPTDGKVNGQRSNFPYGECSGGTTLPSSGGVRALGKLGTCTFPGYSGKVFEPDDQYKGDFARSYFYMAAAYYNRISSWSSDMLAGNQYPAFSDWALKLLLKWHRQDPVSTKETERNDAVYAYQHNRNPFIDHPELVEYIWGDKKSERWSASATAQPEIVLPIDGATLDFGSVVLGRSKSLSFTVRGVSLTSNVVVATSADGFVISPNVISPAGACSTDGVKVTVTYTPEQTGKTIGILYVRADGLTTRINLLADCVDGMRALPATNISDRSFTASWTYIGDADATGRYTLYVRNTATGETQSVKVNAEAEEYDYDGLSPETSYEYWLTTQYGESNHVSFTTAEAIPGIQLLYDGVLEIEAPAGEPSQVYEILIDAENITEDITVAVASPFALSTDKSEWSTHLTLNPEEQRFYLRMYGDTPGIYYSTIYLAAGDYENDDITISGRIYAETSFHEDFEGDISHCGTYNGCTYTGVAEWYLDDAGLWASDKKYAYDGDQCVRMGKSASSSVTMVSDKGRGIGTVSLWAMEWSDSEGPATFHLEYSVDHGNTWHTCSAETEVSASAPQQFTFTVNVSGDARLRVQQTAGKRFLLDAVSISDYTASLIDGVDGDYHGWDAWCRDGRLVIETRSDIMARVYGYDGIMYHDARVGAGVTTVDLPAGLYVVAVDGFTRVVLIK